MELIRSIMNQQEAIDYIVRHSKYPEGPFNFTIQAFVAAQTIIESKREEFTEEYLQTLL